MAPKSTQQPPFTHAQKRRTEITLGGSSNDWTVSFSPNLDLSSGITFIRNDPTIHTLPPSNPTVASSPLSSNPTVASSPLSSTTHTHTLSLFSINLSLKFRETRIFRVRRDQNGVMRDMNETFWAAVEITPNKVDVVHHGEVEGGDWLTILTPKPGQRFTVDNVLLHGPYADGTKPLPAGVDLDVLRLWNQRAQVQAMRYMGIRVRNHQVYTPWCLVRDRGILGDTVTHPDVVASSSSSEPVVAGPSTTRPEKEETEREVEVEEEEPLIDLFGEDDLPPPAEASAPRKHRSGDTWLYQGPGGVDLLTGEEEEGKGKGKEDPFRDVWEDAREREEKRKM